MAELRGNVDELVAQVHRSAERRALATEAAADAQAARIEGEGAARVEAARAAARAECAARTAEQRRSQLARADLDRRQARLDARETRLERVWDAARAELERLARGPDGDAARAALCRDAARRLGGDAVVVTLDPDAHARLTAADIAAWADADGPALEKDAQPLPAGHGARVSADRASVDATFEGRLMQAREVLRGTVAGLLAGTTPDGSAKEAP